MTTSRLIRRNYLYIALTAAMPLLLGIGALNLPLAHAAGSTTTTTTTPCTVANQNGCIELSATPPQATVAVPPNIMLMLDDSGSMAWDVMPDYGFLTDTSDDGLVNSGVNGLYYDPTQTYPAPPKADGSSYPNVAFDDAPVDGFDSGSNGVDLSTYHGGDSGGGNQVPFSIGVYSDSYDASCPNYANESQGHPGYCYFSPKNGHPYEFTDNGYYYAYICKSHDYIAVKSKGSYKYKCEEGASFFYYTTGSESSGYTRHYVAKNASDCATAGLSDDVCTADATVKQNVANWFSYYHTRILMAKSALMRALSQLSSAYRFGYGTIHKGIVSDVVPFGDGAVGTQKADFWTWLADLDASGGTPLRSALDEVGQYYETAGPWETMKSDPNYVAGGSNSAILQCRASYTILTTDGFWNGDDPSSKVKNAANEDGPPFLDKNGKSVGYKAQPPFSGDEAKAVSSYYGENDNIATLADVATYYWGHDLQPTVANLVPANANDPAFWQHMTTYTMGLGFSPVGIQGTAPNGDSPPTVSDIFAWARNGDAEKISDFKWPQIVGGISGNGGTQSTIADLAHAAVNGHGDFFNAKSPQELASGFSKAIAQISARNVAPTTSSVNVSVATTGSLAFSTGYNTGNWSGTFEADELNADGTTGAKKWDAGTQLDAMDYTKRNVFTAAYSVQCPSPATGSTTSGAGTTAPTATFDDGLVFSATDVASLDCTETADLAVPALLGGNDTLANRINYLLGDRSLEGTTYRIRTHVLGAIINSQPVYVSYPSSGYYNVWPANSPEADAVANGKGYSKFMTDNADRAGTVYVAANDGMLHAFAAPAPTCTTDASATTTCDYGDGGAERWAFVPRAVYDNLGNLTSLDNFKYRPTVDATPVTRDVYFDSGDNAGWNTLLVGGVGLGGRGVYALNVTDPKNFDASDVLWEFDSDMTIDTSTCTASYGTCKASDLGYTVPQPNIGRLHNGKWVVLVPNGYFPDCTMPDTPTNEAENSAKTQCQAIADQAPKDKNGNPYSALFVLDAQTGKVLAELKTPTGIKGVTSFGLGPAVLGDYNNDQVDDVAYAGDLEGNLWRFDLSSSNPADWSVTLAYKGKAGTNGGQGIQPITTMPHLFPDPATNRFMVVFGTGKYLGAGDNTTDIPTQALYGIRDELDKDGNPVTVTADELLQQTLGETAGTGDLAGATLRTLTNKAISAGDMGWVIPLDITSAGGTTNEGERVVVTPGALFSTNTAVFSTLIPSTTNFCDPSVSGAIMFVNADNGGSSDGVSMLGGMPYIGARVTHVRTGGTLPMVGSMGGGKVYLPGTQIQGTGTGTPPSGGSKKPLAGDTPVWRRRSWTRLDAKQ